MLLEAPIERINANSYFRSFSELNRETNTLIPEMRMMKKAIARKVSIPTPINVNKRLTSMAGIAACIEVFSLTIRGTVITPILLLNFTNIAVNSFPLQCFCTWNEFGDSVVFKCLSVWVFRGSGIWVMVVVFM